MAHQPPSHHNGAPASERGQRPHHPVSSFVRQEPFSLPEVLPYSPQASILPFESGVIPTPSIGPASPAPSLQDLIQSPDFDTLNQEASSAAQSKRFQQTIGHLQSLIGRGTTYTFKTKPKATAVNTLPPNSMTNKLTPVSRMVVNRLPTPDTPGPPDSTMPNGRAASIAATPTGGSKHGNATAPARKASKKVPSASPVQANKETHAANSARFEVLIPSQAQHEVPAAVIAASTPKSAGKKASPSSRPKIPIPPPQPLQHGLLSPAHETITVTGAAPELAARSVTPAQTSVTIGHGSVTPTHAPQDQPPSASQKAAIAIELPGVVATNRNEYQVVEDEPDLDEPMHLSTRKRKRDLLDGDDIYADSLDTQQRAQVALHELTNYVRNIELHESHAVQHRTGNELVYLTRDGEPTLSAPAQAKVQGLLAKAISLNCYHQIELDDLLLVSRLSDAALKATESLELRISESWEDADVEQWMQQLPELEIGLKAARTALRLMCGGREEKQLYSEDVIDKSLDLFKNVLSGIILPMAELRGSDKSTAAVFKKLHHQRKRVIPILNDFQKLFNMMATLIAKVDVSEMVSNTLESTATQVLFMETAHSEKDSVVETSKFDSLRVVAMDTITHIFLMNPAQRRSILDEILTSLEKLPLAKQRARQFKLVDGTNIQPVSALIMRLLQACAGKYDDSKEVNRAKALQSLDGDNEAGPSNTQAGSSSGFTVRDEEQGADNHATAVQEMQAVETPLMDMAKKNALYVADFLVKEAMKSTKSGDNPYRNLLDLFVEDFTACLDNPDWPSAELLLRQFMLMMFRLVDDKDKKASAPAKNMALEVLGVIGAAISTLRGYVRKASNVIAVDRDELSIFISNLASEALETRFRPEHLVSWTGPFRVTLEYLEGRRKEDPYLASAISFLVTSWAHKVGALHGKFETDIEERDSEFGRLAYRLREMILDRQWLTSEYQFKIVSSSHAKLSYAVTLLRMPLCEAYNNILGILLHSMSSDQATVRSKSLKSVNQVLETDPSILDGESSVIQLILRCVGDSSTQVRDSALGLIGKCISLRPALEVKMVETVTGRFSDAGPGVRKRAMKLARDIYLRNPHRAMRSNIASGLLFRVQDPEDSVRDLARQMVEEIWIAPFFGGETDAASQISMANHVALMVQTVQHGAVIGVLDKVLHSILSPTSKTYQANLDVCKKLVASMFDMVNNPPSDDPNVPTGSDVLQVLTVFAKVEAGLFTFEQIRLLAPHIQSLASILTQDDMAASRAAVVIYRRVLPQLSSVHKEFLQETRARLSAAVGNATKLLLDDIVSCLWTLSIQLNSSENLARMGQSCIVGILQSGPKIKSYDAKDKTFQAFRRYSMLLGMLGKHCDLESHLEGFKAKVPKYKGPTVSKLMVDTVLPFCAETRPMEVRKVALESVGLVCQSWPKNYVSPNVFTCFENVFQERTPALEAIVLRSLKEFLLVEEKRSEGESDEPKPTISETEKKRQLGVMGGTNYDDVASATTQRFMAHIIRIATASVDEHAFLAVEVLSSINRQGLVHPKETGVTFISLETSTNPKIAELAFIQHKVLHEKHETVVEREYVKAIQAAFHYQRDVVKDPRGATTDPFTSKLSLMMDVLKVSRSKNRQKFLEKFVMQVDFDLAKVAADQEVPDHVQYARFIVENLAFFEFVTIGELQATISTIEKLVSRTGAPLAQVIEAEVQQIRMDTLDGTANNLSANPQDQFMGGSNMNGVMPNAIRTAPNVEFKRLRQLTSGSMILLMLWEARVYLRRLYGMNSHSSRRESKGKTQAKDLAKAPVKAQTVTGDKFWEDVDDIMKSLESRERMVQTCGDFVELMNVDKEVKIAAEDDADGDDDLENGVDGPNTPSGGEEDGIGEPSSGRGRKRKSAGGGTPGAKRKRARSSSQPRKRGRPRKQSIEIDADGELDEEFF